MRNASKFGRGTGVYSCTACTRKTRQTGGDNDSLKMCEECYEIAGLENTIADHGDPEERHASEIARLTHLCRSKGGIL